MRIARHTVAGCQCQSAMTSQPRKRLRGTNSQLMGYAIAVGLGAVLVGLTFAYGGDAKSDGQVSAFYDEIVFTANKITSSYDGDYTRLGPQTSSETKLATIGLVPSKYIVAGSAVTPWNGRFQAYGVSLTNFAIVIRDTSVTNPVSTVACAAIVSRLAVVSRVVSFSGTTAGTLSPAAASTASDTLCSEGFVTVTMS